MAKQQALYPIWRAHVDTSGVLYVTDAKNFDIYLEKFKDKDVLVTVKRVSKDRSNKEERYCWRVVYELIAQAMETSREEAHELCKTLFLTEEESTTLKDGRVIRYKRTKSTTELNDKEYHTYIFEKVIPWAALPTEDTGLGQNSGLGIYIPLPNEVDYDQFI